MDHHDPTTERHEERDKPGIPETLSRLRLKLSQKAKQEPKFRFYALYDRIYRLDTLTTAWILVRRNGGAPGSDGVTFEQIQNAPGGVGCFLSDLQEDLRSGRYTPAPIRRTYIPKANGQPRPLGIPTIRDRVCQMAALLILEPIFEADFKDCSFGFRPGRSAHQALQAVAGYLQAGYRAVYDVDLQGYFDSIPHERLLACLRMRVADRSVLRLVRLWLTAVVLEEDEAGRTRGSRPRQGTPQGGVLSPLLANVYLHWFDTVFHRKRGPARFAQAKLVRYADDFVVLARHQGRRLTAWVDKTLEDWLGLRLNRDKTRVVDLNEEGSHLDFLGYSFRYEADLYGRSHRYLRLEPSVKALRRARERVRQLTGPASCWQPLADLLGALNRYLRGWVSYFSEGQTRRAYRTVGSYVRERVGRHLRRRSQRPFRVPEGISLYGYLQSEGLRML